MSVDPGFLVVVAAVFTFAGAVKGVIGLGLPTIAMGLLGAVILPVQAAAILVLPTFLTNVWQVWGGPPLLDLVRRLSPALAGIVFATVASAGIVVAADPHLTAGLLGTVLVLYAGVGLWRGKSEIARRREPWLSPVVGLATGAINGATGIFMVPLAPYLQSLELDKEELVQALGLGALAASSGLAAGLGLHDGFSASLAAPIAVAVAASFAGMAVGRAIRARLSVEVFRRWVLLGLLALGAAMIARAIA